MWIMIGIKLTLFKVIPCSHLAGRLDHNKAGGQYEADPERVEYFKNKFGSVNVELMPGVSCFI